MTDAVFTVRVVLDGDDDTDQSGLLVIWELDRACQQLKAEGILRAFEVVREP